MNRMNTDFLCLRMTVHSQIKSCALAGVGRDQDEDRPGGGLPSDLWRETSKGLMLEATGCRLSADCCRLLVFLLPLRCNRRINHQTTSSTSAKGQSRNAQITRSVTPCIIFTITLEAEPTVLPGFQPGVGVGVGVGVGEGICGLNQHGDGRVGGAALVELHLAFHLLDLPFQVGERALILSDSSTVVALSRKARTRRRWIEVQVGLQVGVYPRRRPCRWSLRSVPGSPSGAAGSACPRNAPKAPPFLARRF